MFSLDIYEIRSRYTTPDNACKPDVIQKMAAIAIAHDVASLVGEVEECRKRSTLSAGKFPRKSHLPYLMSG